MATKECAAAADGDPPMSAAAGWVGESRWKVVGICALLVLLVALVFGQTLRHGFVSYDDNEYVYENAMVCKGLSFEGLRWAFTHVHSDNWHPLTTISHMFDCQVYGLWAGGHHLNNLLLHAAAAVLLFLALREMTRTLWRSAFAAAVFAVHPLRVESVAWVAERKDVLSGVFFMLTLWAYARYARRPESWGRYALVAVWFTLGLMSKPMLVTLPFVLLLLDYWPLGRLQQKSQLPRLLLEKLLLFALSALSCVATVIAQREAIQPLEHFPLTVRIGNALMAYGVYLGKTIYPARLAVLYPMLKNGWPAWQVIAALLLLTALTAGAWVLRRKQPYLLVGWCLYLGMLVPVIGILQVGQQAYADRYTYLPQIGLCLAVIWALADWLGERRRVLLGGLTAVVLGALLVMSYRQVSFWRDSESLWAHTLGCTKNNAIAFNNLGGTLIQKGQTEAGITQLKEALRINPAYEEAHDNLGITLLTKGRTEEAIAQFREVLRINPAHAGARYDLGKALNQKGLNEEAIAEYREVLRIDPAYAEAHNSLGAVLLTIGRTEDAIAQFREALRLDPAHAQAHYNLGNVLKQGGLTDEAIAEYREALRTNPAYAEAHCNLGNLLLQQGRTEEAISHYHEALRINPAYAEACNNLGFVTLQQGRTEEAIGYYREALRINPAYANAHCSIGLALFQQRQTEEAIAHLQQAIELQPTHVNAQNSLAWILATEPQRSLRDGVRAVQLATQANQSSGGNNSGLLHTLAAAYAEAGDFPKAVQTAKNALQLAQAQANTVLAAALRRELQLYEAGQPFHVSP